MMYLFNHFATFYDNGTFKRFKLCSIYGLPGLQLPVKVEGQLAFGKHVAWPGQFTATVDPIFSIVQVSPRQPP